LADPDDVVVAARAGASAEGGAGGRGDEEGAKSKVIHGRAGLLLTNERPAAEYGGRTGLSQARGAVGDPTERACTDMTEALHRVRVAPVAKTGRRDLP